MFLFHDFKLIYIIVPGTGSNSFHGEMKKICKKWEQLQPPKDRNHGGWKLGKGIGHRSHWTAAMAKTFIDEHIWNTYEKIAFVRHPYWWARSVYRKGGIPNAIGVDNDGPSVRYLKELDKTPYFWFCDKDGNRIVDTIYRTEDLSNIAKKFGFGFTHNNKTNNPKKELDKTDETAKLLREKFAREYEHYPGCSTFGDEFIGRK
jgi:hypothetical protein